MDKCTLLQKRLTYARVLVEMELKGDFPNKIELIDDLGGILSQPIEYEWKPSRCQKCNSIEHEQSQCRLSQIWIP